MTHADRCPACGGSGGTAVCATERMFGLPGAFTYLQCAGCGGLRLVNPPADLSPYYPVDKYYSLGRMDPITRSPRGAVRRWLWRRRNQAAIRGDRGVWGWIVRKRPPPPLDPEVLQWITLGRATNFDAPILDLGCGKAHRLRLLHGLGFRRLTGVDPYLEKSWSIGRELQVLAAPLEAVANRRFQLIMIHHALEHMADQMRCLSVVASLLLPDGVILIRTPIASPSLWGHYGVEWFELDAPRHLFVHTERSLLSLSQRAGLRVLHREWEDDRLAYEGSEWYRRGNTLYDPGRGRFHKPRLELPPTLVQELKQRSLAARQAGAGGRIRLYLERTTAGPGEAQHG